MSGEENARQAIASIKALAGLSALFYRQLLIEHFSPEQALELTNTMVASTLSNAKEAEQ